MDTIYKIPGHIKNLKPYVPGMPTEELERRMGISQAVKLASNENPIGPSPCALRAIEESLSTINRYPDGSGYYLRKALAECNNIDSDNLILGNGSNELIELLVRTLVTPFDEVISAHPSFIIYDSACQAACGKAVMVPLRQWRHDLEKMGQYVTEKTKIIFIANPNNPTGTINRTEEIEYLLKAVPPRVIIALDEAYNEYVEDDYYPNSLLYLKERDNIIIFRTFSKIYGLAGLRVGYAISHSSLINEMNKIRPPFNTNTLAQKAALAALNDKEHIEKIKQINKEGKAYLYRELRNLGVDFVPTEANFIYIPTPEGNASEVYQKLLKKGVIVRSIGTYGLRVTIGLPEENMVFIKALKETGKIESKKKISVKL
jgi:histidinol-phosphate aminotransferase